MAIFKKKIQDRFFQAVVHNTKRFEIRCLDEKLKTAKIGDTLEQYQVRDGRATGAFVRNKITYVLTGIEWGICEGFAIFGLGTPRMLFDEEVLKSGHLD